MRYIQWFTTKGGIEGEPFPTSDYDYNETSKEGYKIKRAIQSYNDKRKYMQFKRALDVLEVYDKAHKFDALTKRKSIWKKLKDLFRA